MALTTVPVHLLTNATFDLLFGKNRLTAVPTMELAAAPNLHVLHLSYNLMTVLPNNSFATTPNLRSLLFENNYDLQEIHAGAFNNLHFLTHLTIALTAVTTMSRALFSPLRSLQSLVFVFTGITAPPGDLFEDLVNLNDVEIGAAGGISSALATQSLGLAHKTRLEILYGLCACGVLLFSPVEPNQYIVRPVQCVRVMAEFTVKDRLWYHGRLVAYRGFDCDLGLDSCTSGSPHSAIAGSATISYFGCAKGVSVFTRMGLV